MPWTFLRIALVAALLFSEPALGQPSLTMGSGHAALGETVELSLTLASEEPVQGVQAIFEWDGAIGSGIDFIPGPDLLEADFLSIGIREDVMGFGTVRDFRDLEFFGPGEAIDLGTAVIECVGVGTSPVRFVDGRTPHENAPPIDNVVVIGGDPAPDLAFVDGSFISLAPTPVPALSTWAGFALVVVATSLGVGLLAGRERAELRRSVG